MKVLWLASWYPSKVDLYNGDFVQRHAEAASLYHEIDVIHVIKDRKGDVTKDIHVEVIRRNRLTETIVYYYTPFQKIPLIGRLFSAFQHIGILSLEFHVDKLSRPLL